MPKRTDIHKILIIGSGPIVIGQACEFDYSGTQACRALMQEGFEVVLVNSNPATIMTDPEIADKTYIEPLTVETVSAIIEKERPDALLPTVGGQTGLNLSVELFEQGVLEKFGVQLIGANINSIKVGEDRELFKKAMDEIGIPSAKGGFRAHVGRSEQDRRNDRISGDHFVPVLLWAGPVAAPVYIRKSRRNLEPRLERSPIRRVDEESSGLKE